MPIRSATPGLPLYPLLAGGTRATLSCYHFSSYMQAWTHNRGQLPLEEVAVVKGAHQQAIKHEDNPMPDIENFSTITDSSGFAGPTLGFGGATQDSAMTWLKDEGFSTVINLRLAGEEGVDIECSRDAAEAAGLKYVHLPFSAK